MATTLPGRKTTPATNPAPVGEEDHYVRLADINGLLDHVDGWVNVMSYANGSTIGDGSTDAATAISAALAAGKNVIFPPGTYLVNSAISIPAQTVIRGAGQVRTTLKRGFTGDFITSQGSYSVLQDLTIDGDTATRGTGRGILIPASSFGQEHRNVAVKNFVLACLEFGTDGGSEFKSLGSTYYTTGAVGSVAAVKGGSTTQAIPRHFFGTASLGCTLFDFGNCDHWWAYGFYTNGLIFSSATAFNIELRGMRCGSLGGTITVQGDSHFMSGVSAVAWIIKSTSSIYHVQCPSWDLTEQSPAANNSITITNPSGGAAAWTPVWTATTSGTPSFGAGSWNYRYSRNGAWIIFEISITLGSGFATGTGSWEFSLPAAAAGNLIQNCGSAYMANAAVSSAAVGTVQIAAGDTKCRIKTGTTDAGSFGPFTWDSGSVLRFSGHYRVT